MHEPSISSVLESSNSNGELTRRALTKAARAAPIIPVAPATPAHAVN